MHKLRGTMFRKSWARPAQWENRRFRRLRQSKPVKFSATDYHQIWPSHVNRCHFSKRIIEIVPFRRHLPKKPSKSKGSNRYLPTARATHCRAILDGHSTVTPKVRKSSTRWDILYDVPFRSCGTSSFPNFRIFRYFPHKMSECILPWPAYTAYIAYGFPLFPVVVKGPNGCLLLGGFL